MQLRHAVDRAGRVTQTTINPQCQTQTWQEDVDRVLDHLAEVQDRPGRPEVQIDATTGLPVNVAGSLAFAAVHLLAAASKLGYNLAEDFESALTHIHYPPWREVGHVPGHCGPVGLPEEDVRRIRAMHARRIGPLEISALTGLKHSTVKAVVEYRTRAGVV